MKVSLKWLAEYVDDTLPAVENIVESLTMHSFEIEGVEDHNSDKILDVKVLPNRAHDCLSHYGIASEVCSVLNLKRKDLLPIAVIEDKNEISVKIETKSNSRAMFVLIKNINIAQSPEWLKEKLSVSGNRSINNVVDLTNYLTFAFGQPMHAFDADKISKNKNGQYEFVIRDAKDGEKITLLDGKEYTLGKTNMVIADGVKALDVAGVMGGRDSSVSDTTKNILLSFSTFDPVSVRKTSKNLGVRTDASYRFENHIDTYLIDRVLPYALKYFIEVCGGEVSSYVDVNQNKIEIKKVTVNTSKIKNMLGVSVSSSDAVLLLARQNIFAEISGESVVATIPPERLDLNLEEDLVEEIGRIYGYENISPKPLELESEIKVNQELFVTVKIRQVLESLGFTEIYTYAFRAKGEVEILNPLSSDKKFMRSDLTSGMEESLVKNFKYLDFLGINEVKLFEIGRVFKKDLESTRVCLGIKYPKGKGGEVDQEIAIAITKIEEALGVSFGDVFIGSGVAEFDIERILKDMNTVLNYPDNFFKTEDREVVFKSISPFPFAVRDVAVFVPNEISVETVEGLIKQHTNQNVVRVAMFDKFTKGDKTSYAFRLVFQSNEKTLTEEDINSVMNPIYETLKAQTSFEIR